MNYRELHKNVERAYKPVSHYSDHGRIVGEKLGEDFNLNFKTNFSNKENYSYEWKWENSKETNLLEVSKGRAVLSIEDYGPLTSYKTDSIKSEIDKALESGEKGLTERLTSLFALNGNRMFLPLLVEPNFMHTSFAACKRVKGIDNIDGCDYFHIGGPPYTCEYWVRTSDFTVRKARCLTAFVPIGDMLIRSLFTVGAFVTKYFDISSSEQLSKQSKKFCDLYYYLDEVSIEKEKTAGI